MRVQLVRGVRWKGGLIDTYAVLQDGALENESIVVLPTLCLLEAAKHCSSLHTLRAMAVDLKFFFGALQVSGRGWEDMTDDLMSGYLESTLLVSRGLSRASITRAASHLGQCYDFATSFGLTSKSFSFSFSYRDPDGAIIEQGDTARRPNLKLTKKYINEPLFDIIASNANESPGFLRARDELILEIGYRAGLRSSEITHPKNFKTNEIQQLLADANRQKKLTIIVPIIGKRSKLRHIDFDPILTQQISTYMEAHCTNLTDNHLFCAKNGKLLSSSFASRLFCRTKKACLPDLLQKAKDLGEDEYAPYTISSESIKKLRFHSLRHTYTTNAVTYCYENGIDPYGYVPNQLGHADKDTTDQYISFEAQVYNRDLIRRKLSKTGKEND